MEKNFINQLSSFDLLLGPNFYCSGCIFPYQILIIENLVYATVSPRKKRGEHHQRRQDPRMGAMTTIRDYSPAHTWKTI